MPQSNRFKVLSERPVNKDCFILDDPEMGFVAMDSPYDPKPSIKIENGVIVEMDQKRREEFDFEDTFIAGHCH